MTYYYSYLKQATVSLYCASVICQFYATYILKTMFLRETKYLEERSETRDSPFQFPDETSNAENLLIV